MPDRRPTSAAASRGRTAGLRTHGAARRCTSRSSRTRAAAEELEEEEDEDEGGAEGGGAGAARLKGFVGAMRVSKSVYGYRKLAKANAKLLELVELDAPLPLHEYETRGLWIELPSRLKGDLARRGHEAYARGVLHAIEHRTSRSRRSS